eukprot:g29425.t1
MPNLGVPPLLLKATLVSLCMLGFWASEEFAVVLKPLILALMLAGCLEKAVELCEFGIARTLNLAKCLLMCRCNLQPLKLLWQQPQDGAYIALEQSYIPEERSGVMLRCTSTHSTGLIIDSSSTLLLRRYLEP